MAFAAKLENRSSSILVVDPLDSRRSALRNILSASQCKMLEASTYREAISILDDRGIDVIICDTEVVDERWQALLDYLQGRTDPPNLVVTSRLADERLWAEVLNLGGYDVLAQPFDCGEVLRVVRMAGTSRRRAAQRQARAAGQGC